MDIAHPHSLQACIQRSFPAFSGMAAGSDRHILKIEMGAESEKGAGNLRIKESHKFHDKMRLFSAVDALSPLKKRRPSVWG